MRIQFVILTLFVAMIASDLEAQGPTTHLPLRQTLATGAWTFRQADTEAWLPTQVPVSVHTALLQNGKIPDPYYRDNETQLQWIERKDWEFRTTFEVDASVLQRKHIELIFKGLDTYCAVYLNDSLILEADNQFRTWRADVKRWIKPGTNQLHFYFESPLNKTDAEWKALGYELPGGQRTMTRKGQFHYGWDWGPRLVGAGILNKPELVAWNDFMIESVQFEPIEVTPEKARVVARYRYRADENLKISMFIRYDKIRAFEEHELTAGVHEDTMWFDIKDPKLWWTSDLGEPYLYDFNVEIRHKSQILERQNVRTGIRKIELVTEPDADGSTFYFRLNGVPVFARGANYIPQDLFQDRVTGQHYRDLINNVKASNMNMLRVWGGGIYEDDTFYALCDAEGILVWQDFMYACALYPGNGRFLKNAAAEAYEQIVRLRNHPCIALWCGNNENNEAWHNWGWQMQFTETQRTQLWKDYQTLFNDVLRTYVRNYASGVPYWESSPSYSRYNPKSLTEGDNHYWGVWHDEEPFSMYDKKIPRFMSEYGFQSFPEWRTIEAFTVPEDRQLESKVMLHHQRHPRGNALIAEYTRRDYNSPKRFEDFVYVSQLVQADGMRIGIEAHRRHKPYCMGTLYWQLNDVWPVASWSSIDSYGRWKALQYTVRDVFAPVVVLPTLQKDTLEVYIANDLAKTVSGTVRVRTYDFEGKVRYEASTPVADLSTTATTRVWEQPLKTVLGGLKTNSAVVEIILLDPDGTTVRSRRLWYAASPKDLRLPSKPDIKLSVTGTERGFELTLKCDQLAKNVLLQTPADGFFSDNYFDLLPGQPRTVQFTTKAPVNGATVPFTVKSLVDVK
jgi:beta-mannosidase